MAVSAAFIIPLYLAAILGVCAFCCRRELVWVILPILAWTVLHAVFVGSVRYRVPMEPLLAVLAGAGIVWLASRVLGRRGVEGPGPCRGTEGTGDKGPG